MPASSRHQGTRLLKLGAACAAVALTLSGCSILSQPTGENSATEHESQQERGDLKIPSTVAAGAEKFYQQTVSWGTCPPEYAVDTTVYECATVTAPLNWAKPSEGDPITLALIRLPATGDAQGELFTNPGGPGASGIDFVGQSAQHMFSADLREHYDIVSWDPRGVGYSSAVHCYDAKGMDEYLYGVPDNYSSLTDAQLVDWQEQQAREFGLACEQGTGALLGYVDTHSTVQDLDLLRYLLGQPRLDYFGFSYGTDIGAQYINDFPEFVGRIALDGATDPTVPMFDVVLDQQEKFADATRTYLKDCLTAAECPFAKAGSVDGAVQMIRDTMDQVDATTPRNTDGRKLTRSVINTAIAAAMYDESSWQYLSHAFKLWYQNRDPSMFFALADSYNDRDTSTGEYFSNQTEAFTAINCLDYPLVTDEQTIREFNEKLAKVALFDKDLNEATATVGDITCLNWPVKPRVTKQEPVVGKGAAPVLVVATTNDPATPLKWAQALAQQLESATLLTYEGEGHIAYDENNKCVIGAVDSYLIDGTVPNSGTRC